MKIVTYNDKGQKEIVEYTRKVVEVEPPKDEIVIENFPQFRMCLMRSQEEAQYVGGGDKRYERALQKLVTEHHDLYEQFNKKLRELYNESR